MAWNKTTAQERIQKLKDEVPVFDIQRFEDYWPLYEAKSVELTAKKLRTTPPLFNLPKGAAVVVDTIQIYINITNYDEYRLEEGQETEKSHERALRLLHLYYSAADRAIEDSAAQRVDFHNGRVHAVVLERGNKGVTRETFAQALAFINDFKRVADAANLELAKNAFNISFRIGIDVGTCVAINNGSGYEQEPMFLGSSANHAAKLAQGEEAGVYISERASKFLSSKPEFSANEFINLSETEVSTNAAYRDSSNTLVFGVQDRKAYTQRLIADWQGEIQRGEVPDFTNPVFTFSYMEPPLSKIDYADLMPSNSIRMPLVSMFADLSGYTNYIDNAIQESNIREAVCALYVIRQEFQNVVEKDFGGRKVRFIGDCIHAVIAEGSRTETDKRQSVSSAALCAGGLHSSFDLCKKVLGNLDELGLAIGLELGPTPISRIGIRGDRSVRVASSLATTRSEQMQRECKENGVKLGQEALGSVPAALWDFLNDSGYSAKMDYEEVAVGLSAVPSPVTSPVYVRAHAPDSIVKPRAHFKAT